MRINNICQLNCPDDKEKKYDVTDFICVTPKKNGTIYLILGASILIIIILVIFIIFIVKSK